MRPATSCPKNGHMEREKRWKLPEGDFAFYLLQMEEVQNKSSDDNLPKKAEDPMFNSSVVMRSGASLPAHWVIAALLLVASTLACAEIQLTLKNSFVDKYKNRTSISDECVIDHSKGKPNLASSDGDMHAAVRCPKEIGLPMVAEIMNARDHGNAIDLTKTAEADGSKVTIQGAWRIWNEHGGDQVFNQGAKVAAAENTNPDHVFEIHPITDLGDFDLRASFKPIAGYTPKAAEDAFNRYENTRSKIPGKATTTIVSPGIGYNYVEFQMQLMEKPYKVADGSFAFAKVRDWEGHLVLRKKHMVFVKDTPPEQAVRDKKEGDCLRVLGIPRLDLALVSWRARNAKASSDALT